MTPKDPPGPPMTLGNISINNMRSMKGAGNEGLSTL